MTDAHTIFNYVYRVTHLPSGVHYIGSRCSRGLPPLQDLGRRYFTSSKIVTPLFRSAPHEFSFKIVSLHSSRWAALAAERKYQLRVHANTNPMFFNNVIAGERFVGGPKSDDHRNWLKEHTSARHPAVRQKMRDAKLSNPVRYWKNKTRSAETCEKISRSLTGKRKSEATLEKLRQRFTGTQNPFYGKSHSTEARKKMSAAKRKAKRAA
jgi:hypothetical protein